MQATAMLRSMQVVRHTSQAPWSALHTRSLVGSTVTRSSADGDSHREVEPPNVQKLAQLASIGVTDEEAAEWGPKIGSIVEWFGQLQQVDLDGVPPALRAEIGDGNLLREDVPEEFAAREAMLQQAPEMDGAFVKVPKISTGGDQG